MNQNDFLGNVRTGTRGEKDNPIALSYFDVHKDRSTSMLAVEIFNQTFNKSTELIIKPEGEDALKIYYELYKGKTLKCIGNDKYGKMLNDKGKRENVVCNSECEHRKNNTCKKRGRLHFRIKGIEDEGIWCYPIGSENGIENIQKYLDYMKKKDIDISNEWFRLFLEGQYNGARKNYIPDIQRLNLKFNNELIQDNKKEESKPTTQVQSSQDEKLNYILYKGARMVKVQNENLPQLLFKTTKGEDVLYLLNQKSNKSILKLDKESVILPTKINNINGAVILEDYKIIRAVPIETKKAG